MTGDRLYPIHVGRTGDPFKPSVYDAYACTKIDAERAVAESGLKYWASCRQTYVAIPDTMSLMDPIMFHQPLDTCIEFCHAEDAGELLANACEDDVPEEFWGHFYNIGGGPRARFTYLGLMESVFGLLGMGHPSEIFERNWFCLRNFHCQWYEDSYKLNDYLHFQNYGVEEYLQSILDGSPWYVTLPTKPVIKQIMALPIVKKCIKNFMMKPLATKTSDCTMYWINNNMEGRISSFMKSKEEWAKIPSHWNDIRQPSADDYQRLDHGFDEDKPVAELDIADMQQAAKFRGGECLSKKMTKGDMTTKLKWKCWRGHEFEMTPNSVLFGGHWCPECLPPVTGWDFDNEAKNNPFFAQVWYPNHDKDESNYYPPDCHKDIVG